MADHNKNILLVEDDSEITKLLKLHFESQDYKFSSCCTAEDAAKRITTDQFNLIILDITLPR